MNNALCSKDIKSKIVTIVHDYLPLSHRRSKQYIEEHLHEKLMSFFHMPAQSANDVLDEIEFEFSISHPEEVLKAESIELKRVLFFNFERRINPYKFSVPDVSVSDLCEIARRGRWPLNFYWYDETARAT